MANSNVIWHIESNIIAPVFLKFLSTLQKWDKMLTEPRLLSLFLNSFNKFNNARALM